MDGIYFAQGAEAAQDATSWDDAARLCPHRDETKRRVWMNGFAYSFRPAVTEEAALMEYIGLMQRLNVIKRRA